MNQVILWRTRGNVGVDDNWRESYTTSTYRKLAHGKRNNPNYCNKIIILFFSILVLNQSAMYVPEHIARDWKIIYQGIRCDWMADLGYELTDIRSDKRMPIYMYDYVWYMNVYHEWFVYEWRDDNVAMVRFCLWYTGRHWRANHFESACVLYKNETHIYYIWKLNDKRSWSNKFCINWMSCDGRPIDDPFRLERHWECFLSLLTFNGLYFAIIFKWRA